MEDLKFDDLTPEQKKDLQDTITKARNNLIWASMKAGAGIFAANFVSILIGQVIFVDSDPAIVIGYQVVTIIVNSIFMSRYFSSAMKANNDIVSNKIKELTKK